MLLIEIVGWSGSLMILAGYALLSSGRLAARSIAYQSLNVLGAIGLTINGWAHWALPSVFNNLVWSGIGIVALVRLLQRPTAGRSSPEG